MKLRITKDTVLKQTIEQSNLLPDHEKVSVVAGTEFELHSHRDLGSNHVRVAFSVDSLKGRNTWVAFKPHVQIVRPPEQATKPEIIRAAESSVIEKFKPGDILPNEVRLPVPYFSQRDNFYRPTGTCNVTSVAMCLYYYGVRPKRQSQQLEDELFEEVTKRGWSRHSHDHLRQLFNAYGMKGNFKMNATWEEVKRHMANGDPVIYSGKFTKFGHIIVLRGYNDRGCWVNDPWGEYFASGYQNKSGENLHYSWDLLRRLSYSGRDATWAHLPTKGG
jgi:uncharacterized protein YvpB